MELMTTENPRWNEFADALDQMGAKFGCDGDHRRYVHRHARTVMEDMGKIDIEGSLAYFRDHGGYCDCEILLNVDRDWLWADAEPFESWPYQLDLYMRFRADREGVEYALSPEFFLANPADSYFGVIVRDDELIADKQNPEALEAWKHGEKK
jgi:Protein of unknown function (DUF2695)